MGDPLVGYRLDYDAALKNAFPSDCNVQSIHSSGTDAIPYCHEGLDEKNHPYMRNELMANIDD
ncbi:hypothetical protein [Yersinia pekkanenii]|uniref:hypothetical protein n=1 Tax=Yersinia pekkanenii TaxID=1288385 RepID=UPI00066FFAFE|nr:hypothetical protein [Yersinia pekkanenii]